MIIVVVKGNVFKILSKFLNWKKCIHWEEDMVLLPQGFYMNGEDIVFCSQGIAVLEGN